MAVGNETDAISVVDSGVDVQGLRKHQDMLEVFRSHHLHMERSPARARSMIELKRLTENRKAEL